jgi:hypothetical protein
MKTDRKKVGLFVGSDFHARSIVESGVLDALTIDYNVVVFTSSKIRANYLARFSELNFVEFEFSRKLNNLFSQYLALGTAKYMNRSNSFRFRIKRYILSDYFPPNNLRAKFIWASKSFLKGLKVVIRILIGKSPFFKYKEKVYFNELMKQFNLSELQSLNFNILISWSQNAEPSAIAPILLGKEIKVPSLVVVDNWDNLSSKSIFPVEPNALICFGQQSVDFAHSIQKFNNCKIYPIGSARFEIYRGVIDGSEKMEPRQILYAGSSIAAEDLEVLEIFENYYSTNNVEKNFKYRRHPYPQGPELNLADLSLKFPRLFRPGQILPNQSLESLEQTKEELRTTQILVAMPTTFLLEGLLCKIPTVLISFKSEKVRTSSRMMICELEHLKGVKNLQNIFLVNNITELFAALKRLTTARNLVKNDPKLNYLVNWESTSFSQKFIEAIEEIAKPI